MREGVDTHGVCVAPCAPQAHPFFEGILWDRLHACPAPYVPTVEHDLDTQNFEHFDEEAAPAKVSRGSGAGGLREARSQGAMRLLATGGGSSPVAVVVVVVLVAQGQSGGGNARHGKAADPNFIGYTFKNIEAVQPSMAQGAGCVVVRVVSPAQRPEAWWREKR